MARILGISALYHDSAVCLLERGEIVAAVQEERFSRKKHDADFPKKALKAALEMAEWKARDLDYVVFYEKPFARLERLLETYGRHCPRGLVSYLKSIPVWFKEKLWIKDRIRKELDYPGEILFADHHESHAASAFFPSPFQSAALLTVDAVGEWTTTALGRGEGNSIVLESDLEFPNSLGLLYSAFTYYLGFRVNSGEYKVMGLAPYGEPRYADQILSRLIQVGPDGSFRLNREYFGFETGLRMTANRFHDLFQGPPRRPDEPIHQRHRDLAASIQKVTETVLLKICRHLQAETGQTRLCMAGGVALNCVANGRIVRETPFERLWVQPAAGDAGGALGAALAVWHGYLDGPRSAAPRPVPRDNQRGSLLGTRYSNREISRTLEAQNARFERLPEGGLLKKTALALSRGATVGWFQGAMEFGPRALGNRSILADPRRSGMQDQINSRIKFRESFRPFAPAVLEDQVQEYFELAGSSPYMLLVAPVRPERRKELPAVTHVDGSARIQTVDERANPRFHRLLKEFHRITGCPILLNTSFNIRGEPIVESPLQAYQCFMRTGLDYLVLEDCLLSKTQQPSGLEDD